MEAIRLAKGKNGSGIFQMFKGEIIGPFGE